jgi:phosphoglycerol transferase MdoB-like AlkP superfamily enzyme
MLPTPRPVRRVSWLAAARDTGNRPDLIAALIPIFALFALPFVFWGNKIDIDKLPRAIVIILGAFAFCGFLVPPVLLVVFPIILLASHTAVRKAEWLLKWGKPARAVVTHVEYVHSKSVGTWVSTFEYQDDAGNPVKGEANRKLILTDVLTVLYDPDKPTKAIVYPIGGFEMGEPGSS